MTKSHIAIPRAFDSKKGVAADRDSNYQAGPPLYGCFPPKPLLGTWLFTTVNVDHEKQPSKRFGA